MSAIHDALRRAAEADRFRGRGGPQLVPLQGVAIAVKHRPGGGWLGWFLLLVVVGVGGWWFWGGAPPALEAAPELVLAGAGLATTTAGAIGDAVPPIGELAEVAPWTAGTAVRDGANLVVSEGPERVAAVEDPDVATVTEAESAGFLAGERPDWKLQSIILGAVDSLAMINGQTVRVGDEVEGGRVRQIGFDAVVVEWRGELHRLEPLEK
jgi:hypothetical protein